ncbi:translation initiation factor IF-2 [bacterium]|nr:translation initiation factor IF-2 [bacterium]
MSQKTRVFELAKELKLTSKEFLGELKKMRIEVKSHMSVLEDETVAYIKRHWGEDEIIEDTLVPGMQPRPEKEARLTPETGFSDAETAVERAEEPLREEKAEEVEQIEEAVPGAEQKEKEETTVEDRQSGKEPGAGDVPETLTAAGPDREAEPELETGGNDQPISKDTSRKKIPEAELRPLIIPQAATVGEVAGKLNVKPAEVIKHLMSLGVFATINQRLHDEALEILLAEYGCRPEIQELYGEDILSQEEPEDRSEDLSSRPPIVTIMGHVNHGKTSLLDAIRQTNVMGGETGGITQHIGAYQVKLSKGYVTFLDTPGHEAFTSLRARGAQITDIVVLLVAVDDGVQPQTVEAINHAKAAEVPIIVAINKMDKPGMNAERIKQELMQYSLVSEEWGGKTMFAEISAKQRIGVEGLLELILLEAEMLELKANHKGLAKGIIIEAKLDRGRGAVVTVLIQKGSIKVGDSFVAGTQYGRVRALYNDHKKDIASAGPGMPVEILGIAGVPTPGDTFQAVANDKLARQIAMKRQMIKREQDLRLTNKITLDNLNTQIAEGAIKELKIIIKADVQGSAEVLTTSLEALSTEKVKLVCIHSGVGDITESDILLASASNAVLFGFNVRPGSGVEQAAKREEVDVRIYGVIYELVEDVRAAMEGLLEPHYHEVHLGRAEVKMQFKLSSGLFIAGSQVMSGKILRNAHAKVLRAGQICYEGKIDSLRRFKEDAKEVGVGMECGIGMSGFKKFQPGDIVEAYNLEAVAQKL